MKPKSILTILLLAFVVASVGYLFFKQMGISGKAKMDNTYLMKNPGVRANLAERKENSSIETADRSKIGAAKSGKYSSKAKRHFSKGGVEVPGERALDSKVVIYYFHGNTRCFTCRAIENFSRAAIGNGFPDELQKGRLEFRTVNVEESANEHFVKDYQLVTRSLVLVRFSEGKQEKWKNLDRVWELVRDSDLFSRYVQTETKQFLGGA